MVPPAAAMHIVTSIAEDDARLGTAVENTFVVLDADPDRIRAGTTPDIRNARVIASYDDFIVAATGVDHAANGPAAHLNVVDEVASGDTASDRSTEDVEHVTSRIPRATGNRSD